MTFSTIILLRKIQVTGQADTPFKTVPGRSRSIITKQKAMPKPSPQTLASARSWCSDNLHDILGFADSALAGFLVDVASRQSGKRSGGGGGNVERVVQTMKDGGVRCDEGRLRSFATELCGRCSGGGQAAAGSRAQSRPTNADMMRRAAGYGLVDMDDGAPPAKKPSGGPTPRRKDKARAEDGGDGGSVPGTVVTKDSSKGSQSRKKKKKRRDDDEDDNRKRPPSDRDDSGGRDRDKSRRQRRRRRRSSSSSSSDGSRGAVVDEDALWEAREARREEIRRKRKGLKDDGDGDKKEGEVDESKLTPEERAALERERDIRERDEFAKRLSAKDKKKQSSRIDGDDDDEGTEGAAARMERLRKLEDRTRRLARGESVELDDSDDEDGGGDETRTKQKKSISISDMRAESKRAYLQKRTKRELELLEREIEDEEDLIARVGGAHTLTAEEKRELQLKRDILRMAREHGHVGDDEKEADGYYRLPDEFDDSQDEKKKGKTRAQKGEDLLTGRYVEVAAEKTEQQLWEEGQTQMAAGEFCNRQAWLACWSNTPLAIPLPLN